MMMISKEVSGMACSLTSSSLPLRERAKRGVGDAGSHHHHDRVFDQHLERADQLGAERAVDRAVVARQGHAHHLRDLDLAVFDNWALLAGADRKDGGMRRVDHGGEVIDAVHAEIGYSRGAALIFLRL